MSSDLNVPFKKPDLISDVTSYKVEDLLLEFLYMLFERLHAKDGPGFDETLDFVEDLLMYEEDVYEELMNYKKVLNKALKFKWADVEEKTRLINNPIKIQRTLKQNKINLQWKYRRDLLRFLVSLFYKKQILQYRMTTYAKLEGIKNGIHEDPEIG